MCKGRWVAVRQLGGIVRSILYDFVKSLSHFFAKNGSSLYKGACVAQPQNCKDKSAPSGRELLSVAKLRELKGLFQIVNTPSVIFCYAKNDSPLKDGVEAQIEFDRLRTGASPVPTVSYIIQSVRSTHFFSFFNFLSYLFSAVRLALSLRYDIYFHSVLSFFYHTISLIQIIYFLIMRYCIIICKLCSAFSFARF